MESLTNIISVILKTGDLKRIIEIKNQVESGELAIIENSDGKKSICQQSAIRSFSKNGFSVIIDNSQKRKFKKPEPESKEGELTDASN